MKKKLFATLLTLSMALGIFAGCGSSNVADSEAKSEEADSKADSEEADSETESETASSAETESALPKDNFYAVTEPVTFEFWHSIAETDYIDGVVQAFNDSQDNITVVPVYVGGYSAIKEQIAAAQAAQDGLPGLSVINYPQVLTYVDSGVAEPLDGYIEAWEYENSFYDGFTGPLSVDGTLYAFPYGPSATAIYYNKDLLEEAGYDSFPQTWEEFQTFAVDFYEKTGKTALSILGNGESFNYINTFLIDTGVDPLGDGVTSKVDDPAIVTWVKETKALTDAGAVEWVNTGNNTETDTKAAFINQETLAFAYSTTYYDLALENAEFEVGMSLPLKNANNTSTTAGATLFIPAENEQNIKNAAFQFLQFLTNDDNAKEFALLTAYLPTKSTLIDTEEEMNEFLTLYPEEKVIYENMDTIVPKNDSPYFTKAITDIAEEFTTIFNEGADVEEIIAQTKENVDFILSGN